MLQTQVNILTILPSTAQVCGFAGITDCSKYPGLVLADFVLKIYRTGSNLPTTVPPTPPPYFLMYNGYSYSTATGIICFHIDSLLTSLNGQYTGDIFVRGIVSGSIQMNVGNVQGIFAPFTI